MPTSNPAATEQPVREKLKLVEPMRLYVTNSAGQFLAVKHNDKYHPTHWVRTMEQANSFEWFVDVRKFSSTLPEMVRERAFCVNQKGERITAKDAFELCIFSIEDAQQQRNDKGGS